MKQQLFESKPFKKSYLPNGLASDSQSEVKRYEGILRKNSIYFLILGITFGENKANAIKTTIEGDISEKVPVSILQKHPSVTLILDRKATSLLNC